MGAIKFYFFLCWLRLVFHFVHSRHRPTSPASPHATRLASHLLPKSVGSEGIRAPRPDCQPTLSGAAPPIPARLPTKDPLGDTNCRHSTASVRGCEIVKVARSYSTCTTGPSDIFQQVGASVPCQARIHQVPPSDNFTDCGSESLLKSPRNVRPGLIAAFSLSRSH